MPFVHAKPLVLAQTQWSVTFGSENIPHTFRTYPTAESSTEIPTVLFQYMWRNKGPPAGRSSESAMEIRGEPSYFPAKVDVGLQENQISRWR